MSDGTADKYCGTAAGAVYHARMATLARLYLDKLVGADGNPDQRVSEEMLARLDEQIHQSLRVARKAWGDVDLEDADAVAYLAERVAPTDDQCEAFEALNTLDLYLACACAHGNEQAAKVFREHTRDAIRSTIARHGNGTYIDEVEQLLYARLLAAGHSGRPDIEKFSGSGQLLAWLRVAATRESLNVLRKRRPKPVDNIEMLVDRAIEHAEPELNQLKKKYRVEFRGAFAQAFEKLDERGRNVLRYQYLEGLNLDEMAVVLAVGRSTVARWRAAARVQLFEATKQIFIDEQKISGSEFDSIMRLINSQLDASVQRLLAEEDEPGSK